MRIFLLLLAPLLASGFVTFFGPSAVVRSHQQTHTTSFPLSALITETEAAKVLAKAKDCLKDECSVDAVNDLLIDLRGQKRVLEIRLDNISELITSLTAANLVEETDSTATRDVSEITKSVASIAQVFTVSAKNSGNDYPALAFPMGFTGTPNKDKKGFK